MRAGATAGVDVREDTDNRDSRADNPSKTASKIDERRRA
jgi:hypothetical protein